MKGKKRIISLVFVLIAFSAIFIIINLKPYGSEINNSIEAEDNISEDLEESEDPLVIPSEITQGIDPLHTLDYRKIIEGMFPDKEFEFISQNHIRVFAEDPNYYDDFAIESIVYDYFIDNYNELLVVLRKINPSHAEGLHRAQLAVFDSKTLEIKSSVKELFTDTLELGFFRSNDKTYVMFVGSVTYSGWTGYSGQLYDISHDDWSIIFPEHEDYWEDKMAVIGDDRLVIYERRILGREENQAVPKYEFAYKHDLIWDPEHKTFIQN